MLVAYALKFFRLGLMAFLSYDNEDAAAEGCCKHLCIQAVLTVVDIPNVVAQKCLLKRQTPF